MFKVIGKGATKAANKLLADIPRDTFFTCDSLEWDTPYGHSEYAGMLFFKAGLHTVVAFEAGGYTSSFNLKQVDFNFRCVNYQEVDVDLVVKDK